MVIGLPRRSSDLPTGNRTQPSLMQYSSTLWRSSPLKRMPMPRSSDGGVVERAARVVGQAVGRGVGHRSTLSEARHCASDSLTHSVWGVLEAPAWGPAGVNPA